jgi:hypothetical protein
MRRERTPRAQLPDLPGAVVAELAVAGEQHSERAAVEGKTRTAVMFSRGETFIAEQMDAAAMLKLFPQLTEAGQPEAALIYLRKAIARGRRANSPGCWATRF